MHYSGIVRSHPLSHRFIPPLSVPVNQVTCHLPEYVMYRINIRNRARIHRRTRGGREIFSVSLERSSVLAMQILLFSLRSSPSSLPLCYALPVRSNPKTAIPHLSLHLLDLQRLKRKLVRSHPGCPCIFLNFFSLLPSPFIPATTSSEIKFSDISTEESD